MKTKLIILVAAILFVSLQTKAQLGVSIGYNFAKIDGSSPVIPGLSEKYLSNLSGGIFYDKGILPFLKVRLGILYSPKGSRYEDGDFYSKTTINYIEVPLQAKLKIGPIYALGGVYGAMALNGKTKYHYEIDPLVFDGDVDLDFDASDYKKVDYGFKFGIGLQYGIGPIHLFVQGDYSIGLMNIHDAAGASWKNRVIGVSAGVLIGRK